MLFRFIVIVCVYFLLGGAKIRGSDCIGLYCKGIKTGLVYKLCRSSFVGVGHILIHFLLTNK